MSASKCIQSQKGLQRHPKDTLRPPGISDKMYHVKVDRKHRRTLVLFFSPLAKNSNCFPYKLCVWKPQGYFCACQPSFRMIRRLPNTIPHGHICCKIWFCRCQIARIFTLKSVGQFQHELHAGKIFCSGVSKIADFRHVDMEGQMKGALPIWRQYPLKTMLNAAYQKIFKKCFHFASIFT